MTQAPARILVVDDDGAGRYVKCRVLRGQGYEVTESDTGHAAIEQVTANAPDLVLLDVRLPDIDGIAVCRQIKSALPQVTILQTSSAGVDVSYRVAALDVGADSYLVEPIEPDELIAVVRSLLRMRSAEQEVRRLNDDLEARVTIRVAELAEANRQLDVERLERRKTEAVLWHMQKLEAVGQLTGGIAHDFNNLLTVITGNLELLQEAFSGSRCFPKERLDRLLTTALSAADHGAKITQQLLAFARRSLLQVEVADLGAIIARSESLLRRALGEAISLEVLPTVNLWPCVVDPVQFEAALLNLAVNAHDAMPTGGRFRIESLNVQLDAAAAKIIGAAPGRYVGVNVADTGVGMDAAIMERIFEPFFTTKDVGQGSGLGLSQLYGFIRQSGGHITVESEPNIGTTFHLYLPYSVSLPKIDRPEASLEVVGALGGEKVLVVEDNPDVRAVVVELIEDLGYEVVVASDAMEALGLLRDGVVVDLLFTDVVMPNGMDGMALADVARSLNKDLKVVFTSGYPARSIAGPTPMDFLLISKPYRREQLARVLREALDRER